MKHPLLKTLGLGAFLIGATLTTQAQTSTYTTGFESSSKTGYALGTVAADGIDWSFNSAMIGNQSGDTKNGAKAARIRQVDSIDPYIEQVNPMTDVTEFSFLYSRSAFSGDTAGVSPVIVVFFTSDGITWTGVDTLDLAGVSTLTSYSKTFSPAVSGKFRIQSVSGDNGKRFNIDDISITSNTPLPLVELAKTPTGAGVPLSTNQLTMKYNTTITQGTEGNILLMKSGSTAPVKSYTIPSAEISTPSGDSMAIMSGITLENNTQYYVLMTAGSFKSTATTPVASPAIDDSTYWVFHTVDTTPAPILTSLSETFTACNSSTSIMGVFTQNSLEGTKRWACSNYGHTDSHSVYINGGTSAGVSSANKDYLISINKFDFSAMSSPKLSFWHKKRFEGDVTLKVKISTSYSGTGDPTTVTWTDIHTTPMPAGSNTWEQISNINLTAYKSTPFYLAFYYECDTTGAYEYTIDDIKVENSASIGNNSINNSNMIVLGNPTSSKISLDINSNVNEQYTFYVLDISGRTLNTQSHFVVAGKQTIHLNNLMLSNGLYIVKAVNTKGQISTVKAAVK